MHRTTRRIYISLSSKNMQFFSKLVLRYSKSNLEVFYNNCGLQLLTQDTHACGVCYLETQFCLLREVFNRAIQNFCRGSPPAPLLAGEKAKKLVWRELKSSREWNFNCTHDLTHGAAQQIALWLWRCARPFPPDPFPQKERVGNARLFFRLVVHILLK